MVRKLLAGVQNPHEIREACAILSASSQASCPRQRRVDDVDRDGRHRDLADTPGLLSPAPSGRLIAGHSADFVAAWRSVVCRIFRWRQEGPFAVVPSLLGRSVFAYLPGLNYSDLNVSEARLLACDVADRPHNIRVLSASEGELPSGAPAVLRLDLGAFAHDREAIWKQSLNQSTRHFVRRARKSGISVSEEAGPAALDTFMALWASVCSRHGAPMPPAAMFTAIVDALDAHILIVRGPRGEALASLIWLHDGALAWLPWAASTRTTGAGEMLYWALIESALDSGADILDFGRSPVGGGTYRFKRKFGAVAVRALWLSDKRQDVYVRYALAQKLYRALPNVVTAAVGPRLCRYLAEY